MKRVSAFSYQMYIDYCKGLTTLKRELAKRRLRSRLTKDC